MRVLQPSEIPYPRPDWPVGCHVRCWYCDTDLLIEEPADVHIANEWRRTTSFHLKCPNCTTAANTHSGFAEIPNSLRPNPSIATNLGH